MSDQWKPEGIAPGEFGDLETALVGMREIYTTSRKAGFTEHEGIHLIAAILCINSAKNQVQQK